MATTSSVMQVGFHGEGAGAGDLTWGQLGIWRTAQRTGRTMNVVVMMRLPQGTPLAEMVAVLRFLVNRHPALRTRLRFEGGPSGESGEWPSQQVVAESGDVPLEILDIDDGDDPAAVAEELRSRYELTGYDYENEFPIRMGVVRQSGALAHLVIGYSHVMIDGSGIFVLVRDLANLDRVTGEATAPLEARGPLDLARTQGSPAGRRQSERSIRHWAAQLDRLSAWSPVEPAALREPRFWELVGYSPAMELGMRAVAARTGIPTTYVLLAAYSVAVARAFGRDPGVGQIVVNNRFRPGFADLAAQVSQHGICVVDVAGATFDEVVSRAQSAATSASFYGYYDPEACAALLDETTARKGRPLDISWHINDRRGMLEPDKGDGEAPTEEELAKSLSHSKFYWDRRQDTFDGTLFLQVDAEPPQPDRRTLMEGLPAVYLEVWTDTHHFALDQVEAFVREMEACVVEAAFNAQAVAAAAARE